jgi:hypothetical protein
LPAPVTLTTFGMRRKIVHEVEGTVRRIPEKLREAGKKSESIRPALGRPCEINARPAPQYPGGFFR